MVTPDGRVGAPTPSTANAGFHPATEAEREEVRKQLRAILASPVFQNSKRYSAVLKFIVDQTLEGHGDRLKERTIGIEVFGRAPDYDTASDHVVRSAAAEVRKRLAQYYHAGNNGSMRIEVVTGTYKAQFRRAGDHGTRMLSAPESIPDAEPTGTKPPLENGHRSARGHPWILFAALAVLALSVAALVVSARTAEPFESFWKPILASRAPVLLCVGNLEGGRASQDPNQKPLSAFTINDFHNSESNVVNVYDAITVAKFAGLLRAKGKEIQLASQSDATFADLQTGPTILVGLMNNDWTKRLLPKLRFTVEQSTTNNILIRDRNNPSNASWSVDYETPYLNLTRDYAIVLRMVDPKTEQTVIVAAGITVFGTFAAGDFLTSKSEMRKLAAIAPPGWEKKNMEIILATDVIRGKSGPASVVAAYFW